MNPPVPQVWYRQSDVFLRVLPINHRVSRRVDRKGKEVNEALATLTHQRKAQVTVVEIVGPVGSVLLFLPVSLVVTLESNGERREMKEG